jgi:hypothetical protein
MNTILKKMMYKFGWKLHQSEIENASILFAYLLIVITAIASFLELYHTVYHLRHDRRPIKAVLHFLLSCALAIFSIAIYSILS